MKPHLMPWKKNYYLYQTALFISLLGDFLGGMALNWWILQRSDNISELSSVFLVGNTVRLISLPLLGPIGDRFCRKNVLNIADALSCFLCLLLALTIYRADVSNLTLCVLTGLMAFAGSLFRAGSFGMVPELVPRDKIGWAIAQNQIVLTISVIVGGAVGSLLISFMGVFWTLLLNGAAVGTALVLIRNIDLESASIGQKYNSITAKEWFADFIDGMKFIRGEKVLLMSLVILLLINTLFTPFDLTLPYYIQKIRLASVWEFGLIESSIGIGSIVGSLIFSFRQIQEQALRTIFCALILLAFCFMAFGFIKSTLVLVMIGAMIGMAEVLFFIPIRTRMALYLPHQFRSRMGTIFMFGQQLGKPLAITITTYFTSSLSVSTILLTTAVLILALIPLILMMPTYANFIRGMPAQNIPPLRNTAEQTV